MPVVSQAQKLHPYPTASVQLGGIGVRSTVGIGGASIGKMQRLKPKLQGLSQMTMHISAVAAWISSRQTQILVQIEAGPSPTQLIQILRRPEHEALNKGCIQRIHGSSSRQSQGPSQRQGHREPLTQMGFKALG
jgi:hypothetical protein